MRNLVSMLEERLPCGLAYWYGACMAALRECEDLEHDLDMPSGTHINLYYRLKQWLQLLDELEALRKEPASEEALDHAE